MAKAQEEGPLLLLDGMSLAFRAFFALPPEMATSSGIVTNAVHGFVGMLALLVREQRPSGVAVAFDLPGPTFRDAVVEDYKGGRDATPPELEPQIGIIIELARRPRDPDRDEGELRGGRRPRDARNPSARRGSTGHRRHRGPRLLPARGGPLRARPVQPARCLGVLALRRGRDLRAHRRRGGPLPAPRRAAGGPVRQPARRAGGGGEDRCQAPLAVQGLRRALRRTGRPHAQAPREPACARGAGPAQRRGHDPRARPGP